MKKIFTLAIASMLTLSLLAADRRPTVKLTTDRKFEVVIDGKSYASALGNTMDVSLFTGGRHTIKVYALRGGLFSKQRKLVSTSTFELDRKDVDIRVDRSGQILVKQEKIKKMNKRDRRRN